MSCSLAFLTRCDWRLCGCRPDEPDDALIEAAGKVGELFSRDGAQWRAVIAEVIIQSR